MPPARKTRAAVASASATTSSKSSDKQAQVGSKTAAKSTRATASRANATVAEGNTPAPKRRLRSTANSNSPLASLPDTGRKKTTRKTTRSKGKAAASASSPPESERSASESVTAETGQESDGDPGANVFLKQLRQRDNTIHTIEEEKDRLQRKVNSGSPSKAWLLRKDIEDHAKNVPRGVRDLRIQQEEEHDEDPDTVMRSPPTMVAVTSPAHASPTQAPSTPEATSAQAPSTPWSQSLIGWTRNLFGSATKSAPQPTSQAAPAAPAPLTMTLTQSPTPVGEARPRQNKRKKVKELSRTMDKVVYYTLKSSIAAEEWETARPWVVDISEKIAKDKNSGEKRKRLQKGIKVGDLKAIPSTKPWKAQGSFGLDEDIEDLSDSEDAPSWAVASEILAEIDAGMQPTPAKRRKLFTGGDEMVRPRSSHHVEAAGTSLNVFNTSGSSADVHDLKPRSAVEPSPMFDMAAVHRDGSNVFNELQGQAAGQQSAAEKRALVNNSVPKEPKEPTSYSQGFSVPDDSDSDEESNDWTQAPPPAPVPAHASLPNSFAETQRAQDPAEIQRAKLMKYTPAKPSRLREIHVPSPSLKSDAGASPAPAPMIASEGFEMPDAEPLDLPEDVQAYIDDYINSGKAQAYADANPWDDPIATYSDDEEMSEE